LLDSSVGYFTGEQPTRVTIAVEYERPDGRGA
jgi:hypothetical protein